MNVSVNIPTRRAFEVVGHWKLLPYMGSMVRADSGGYVHVKCVISVCIFAFLSLREHTRKHLLEGNVPVHYSFIS